MDQATGAEEMGTRREQPEGAASWVEVQPEEGAASVAGRAWVYTDTLSVWAACGWWRDWNVCASPLVGLAGKSVQLGTACNGSDSSN